MKKKNKKIPTKSVIQKIQNSGIVPLADRVLIRPMTVEALRQAGGKKVSFNFVLPESVSSEKSAQGTVLSVGEGKIVDGKLQAVRVKVGDTVIFSKYSYDEVNDRGEDLYLLKEENILAIIN